VTPVVAALVHARAEIAQCLVLSLLNHQLSANGFQVPAEREPPATGRPGWLTWRTLVVLALIPAAANGFGSIAYGLVLPAIRQAPGWSASIPAY
jgi:hypothetical protein